MSPRPRKPETAAGKATPARKASTRSPSKTPGKPASKPVAAPSPAVAAEVATATKPARRPAPAKPRRAAVTEVTYLAVTADQREKMIAFEAYLRAERRGFSGGSPEQDWLEAEREVDALLRSGDVPH